MAQPRAGVREHRSRLVASIENVQKGNGAEWLRPQDRRIIKALSSSVAVGAQSTLQWCRSLQADHVRRSHIQRRCEDCGDATSAGSNVEKARGRGRLGFHRSEELAQLCFGDDVERTSHKRGRRVGATPTCGATKKNGRCCNTHHAHCVQAEFWGGVIASSMVLRYECGQTDRARTAQGHRGASARIKRGAHARPVWRQHSLQESACSRCQAPNARMW